MPAVETPAAVILGAPEFREVTYRACIRPFHLRCTERIVQWLKWCDPDGARCSRRVDRFIASLDLEPSTIPLDSDSETQILEVYSQAVEMPSASCPCCGSVEPPSSKRESVAPAAAGRIHCSNAEGCRTQDQTECVCTYLVEVPQISRRFSLALDSGRASRD